MAVPSVMNDLSVTAATNSPAGTESPTAGDDFLRAVQAIVRTTNAKGSDIASATTTDIGAATAEFVDVTGTTTITGLGTIGAGISRTVRFTGALILTHNATSLILPGSANITTANGDVAQFRSLGSGNWLCTNFMKKDGTAILGAPFIDSTAIIKGSADATKLLKIEVDGFTTATTRTITPPDKDITVAGLVDIRSYLAGCTLSTAGSSATMSIAAGQASDSTNVFSMTLAAISKTTSAWAVGTAAGGLDTGAIANSTWYYFYMIRRPDTGVVDVVFSLSSSLPTLPANYTQYRYIGGALTNGSAQWVKFIQVGDEFWWDIAVLDFSAAASTTGASQTVTLPRGRKIKGIFNISAITNPGTSVLISDPDSTNNTPSATAAPLANAGGNSGTGTYMQSQIQVFTNTSAQIRQRSTTTQVLYIATAGWVDTRDRFN